MGSCLFFFKLRHGVLAIAAAMFLVYVVSPFIPHILSPTTPNLKFIDFVISGIGCIMCVLLFFGAASKSVWITFLGFVGYVAMIASLPAILYFHPNESFLYLDPRKFYIFVIHMAIQLYCIPTIGFFWYELRCQLATQRRRIIDFVSNRNSDVVEIPEGESQT